MISDREILQTKLVDYLISRNVFDSPKGIVDSIEEISNGGKVRKITFGQVGWLDATIYIFSINNIVVDASGPTADTLVGKYKSYEDLIEQLEKFK